MRISDEGLAFLIREEGSIPYAYADPVGCATFGVGHLLGRRPVNAGDRARWGTKANPKPELVVPTLRADLREFELAVGRAVRDHVHLSQHQVDALVSLAFNIGVGAFATSTVVRRLNVGNLDGAADAFLLWSMAGGEPILRARRQREADLFRRRDTAAEWLREDELRWVREHDGLLRVKPPRRAQQESRLRVLRRVMTNRRKSIWREAQKTGWDVNDRRRRYKSLMSRTR